MGKTMKNTEQCWQDAAIPGEPGTDGTPWLCDEPYLVFMLQTRRKAEAAIESEYGIRVTPDIPTPPYVECLIRGEYERQKAVALRCACRTDFRGRNPQDVQEHARRIRDTVETERWRKHDD